MTDAGAEPVGYRLSPQQRQACRHGLAAWPATCVMRLGGTLDIVRLAAALARLAGSHEILRTAFEHPPGALFPYQVILETGTARLAVVDLRSLPPGAGERERRRLCEERRELDLAAGPAWRCRLVIEPRRRCTLVVGLPTLAADRPTLHVLAASIARAYAAASGDEPPDEVLQYADFAAWQDDLLAAAAGEAGGGPWPWDEAPPAAGGPLLAGERVPAAGAPFRAGAVAVPLDAETAARLDALAAAQHREVADLCLAGWLALLWRLTGQAGLRAGLATWASGQQELATMLGPRVRCVPVACTAAPDQPFTDLWRQVAAGARAAAARQDSFSWEPAIERGAIAAAAARADFAFALDDAPRGHRGGGLELRVEALDCCTEPFRLELTATRLPALALSLRYDQARFGRAAALTVADSLAALLRHVAAEPAARLEDLALAGPAVRRAVTREWNETGHVYPAGLCLHQLFAAAARRSPGRTALVCGEAEVSYEQLDRQANRLAHRLGAAGIGPERVVAVCLDRSPALAVALLAVLKAGGAYLALDPEAPAVRLEEQLAAGGSRLLITAEAFLDRFSGFGGDVFCWERDARPLAALPAAAPASAADPENLAYLVFTSGTSGRPKAVACAHRGAVSYLTFLLATYGVGPADTVLQLAPPTFDASVRDLLGPLTVGARVVLVPRAAAKDPAALLAAAHRFQATVALSAVPSLLRAMAAAQLTGAAAGRSLHTVFSSGERLYGTDCRRVWAAFGAGCRLVNQYGPTECTMTSSHHQVAAADAARDVVPIGRPVGSSRFYVLDRRLEPLPPGAPGALYIGGAGVTRGYLGQPDATAERYLPDPFAERSGGRMYATGDVVRALPDRSFEFLGRRDDQVKIRGHRVEPGEVEAALRRHPLVRDAAVVSRDDGAGEVSLRAYYVPADGAALAAADLRRFLVERLPAHLLPAALVELSALPLNRHGKLDRAALPEPAAHDEGGEGGAGAPLPRSLSEAILTDIWREVLEIERLGPHDDFFALGGHSLLATQVVARVRQAFALELPLQALFDRPTLAGLASAVDEALGRGAGPAAPPLAAAARTGDLPLSFAQERLWVLSELEPGSVAYHIASPLEVAGPLRHAALERALGEVVRRHEALRTTFHATAAGPVQRLRPPARVRVPRVDLRALPADRRTGQARRIALGEAARPFALDRGPLLRVSVLRLGEERRVVLLALHHLVGDLWSVGLLVAEVATLYAAAVAGTPARLAELPVQYPDFAIWQRRLLSGERLGSLLAYWREELADAPRDVELPGDRPRPATPGERGGRRQLRLPPPLVAALRDLGRGQGATLFMTLLAGFLGLLQRLGAGSDLVVGTPVAGRDRIETERLIGLFVNTLALRVDLRGGPTVAELLGRVRAKAIAAHRHQDLPFEKLVMELAPRRDVARSARSPLFQVMFSFQSVPHLDLPPQARQVPGLVLSRFESPAVTAKFDLELLLWERDGAVSGDLEYAADLYDAATIERLAGHFERLLGAAAAAPAARLADLPLLAPSERHQVRIEWSGQGRRRPAEQAGPWAHELIAARAAARPSAPAARDAREAVDYGELNRRANRIAHWLRRRGAASDELVGVLAARGVGMLAAILGIAKAGAAYVPLDRSYPRARLASIAGACRLRWLLADAHELPLARELVRAAAPRAVVLCWDEVGEAGGRDLALLPAVDPPGTTTAHSLANVFFTSGSTGAPKGAMVEHGGMLNHLWAKIEALGLDAASVVAQNAACGFDISIWQFLAALMVGGQVVVYDDAAAMDAGSLLARVERDGVTVLETVPSLLAEMLAGVGPEVRLPGLAALLSQAETLPPPLCRRWFERFPHVPLWNAYGTTECSDDFTHQRFAAASDAGMVRVPVGRPIAGARVLVLDRAGQMVPVGVPGQVACAGVAVGRGYLGDPAQTAERYAPNPLAEQPGERLYWTGDLGRFTPAGTLDVLGRIDWQRKLRGQRIELGEVEAALARQPPVRQAAVVLVTGGRGPDHLAAFVTAEEGGDLAGLRAAVARELPAAMVPARILPLAAMPLTANGKIDRPALAALAASPAAWSGDPAGHVPPATPTEQIVAATWEEVLGRERVSAGDDFFARGGHSLLAIRVLSRLRAALAVEVPLRELFDAPVLRAFAARLDELRRQGAGLATPPLRRARRDGAPPLSFAQQRLWFLDQLDPGDVAYNVPAAVRLTGALGVAALRAALCEIVRRHEVLRTTFAVRGGRACQVVAPFAPRPLPLVDLAALPAPAREAAAGAALRREAWRGFDLARGPLLRTALLRLDPGCHLLAVNLHHVVADGWSMRLLVDEALQLYQAAAAGRPSPLPELPVQYADYAVWQRQWLQGEAMERLAGYWRRQLAGLPPRLDLPFDRPRPAILSPRGRAWPAALPAAAAAGMDDLARRSGATAFMVLAAALSALLARTSGQDDFALGTPVASRSRLETEPLIGFLVNTLVLRADVSGGPSFSTLLARCRETALAAHTHQDLPFEKLVEELQPARRRDQSPLFQVLLALEHAEDAAVHRLAEPRVEAVEVPVEAVKFDLSLVLTRGTACEGAWLYRTDLFDTATVERLAGHFVALLAAALAAPETPVGALSLLGSQERRQLAAAPGPPPRRWPAAWPLHARFAEQARRAPDAVAVCCEDLQVTYGELDRRAGELAGRLRRQGVGPEVVVGLFAERSVDQVAGILGILKAGGAYLALDPAYPRERLALLLADSAASIVVAQRRLVPQLPPGAAAVIDLEGVPGELPEGGAVAGEVLPENPAYVIYTSGSTGRPKGVVITHANVCRLFAAAAEHFTPGPADVWTLFHSIAFDFSVWELWGALLHGGRLIVVPGTVRRSPVELHRLLARERVTVLNQTPSAFRGLAAAALAAAGGAADLDALRTVVFGGEALLLHGLQGWFERFGDRQPRLVNMYGITETTVHVTCRPLAARDLDSPLANAIGGPLAHLRLHLLDACLRPVPDGVVGEVHVAGDGLCRGYLGRPELTAERLLPDPLAEVPGGRLYRSGDLARRRGGDLEYLGRADGQVKIRGYRIEPGEIEAALASHPEVREAVVAARDGKGGSRLLVAYVVPHPGRRPAAAELLRLLRRRLPEHMVPSAVVELPALPLTANGKLDRAALPAPGDGEDGADLAPPRTPVEQALAEVWAGLLERSRIGRQADFFELGGHSLLATQLAMKVQAAFGVELPLRRIFDQPSLAGMALEIERLRRGGGEALAGVRAAPRGAWEPLSLAQRRVWFLSMLNPESPGFNLGAAARLRGRLDLRLLDRAFTLLGERHEALRTSVVEIDGEPWQRISPPSPRRAPRVDLSRLARPRRGREADRLIAGEARRPFALDGGPLLRARVLSLGADEHLLILGLHHLVGDGGSLQILVRDLLSLYRALATGRGAALAPLPVQYADFCRWQQARMGDGRLADQLAWWRRHLGGDLPALQLPRRAAPAAHGAPAGGPPRSGVLGVELPRAALAGLRALGREQGATPFMSFAALLAVALHQVTGQEELVVGANSSYRNRPELEQVIGCFTNTLALRLDLSGWPTFRQLLDRTRQVALDAFANQDVDFELVLRELQPLRQSSPAPVFQVMLAYESPPLPPGDVPGLALEPLPVETRALSFDLTLRIEELGDGADAALIYDPALYEERTVLRLAAALGRLLAAAAAQPDLDLRHLTAGRAVEAEEHIGAFTADD